MDDLRQYWWPLLVKQAEEEDAIINAGAFCSPVAKRAMQLIQELESKLAACREEHDKCQAGFDEAVALRVQYERRLHGIQRTLLALCEGAPEIGSGQYVEVRISSNLLRQMAEECNLKSFE